MAKTDRQQLKERLDLFPDEDTKNLDIQTPEDLGYEYVYHISIMRQKVLVANMSRKAAYTENNTILRVCCAPTLRQCIQGFATLQNYLHEQIPKDVKKSDYRGGLYIHRYKFKAIGSPNKKLVYDAPYTDEKWLIPYDPKESEFPVEVIGKLIPLSDTVFPNVGKHPTYHLKCILEISKDEIPIDKGLIIKKGYYTFTYLNDVNKPNCKVTDVVEVDKKDYDSEHDLKTANLSFKESIPTSMKW